MEEPAPLEDEWFFDKRKSKSDIVIEEPIEEPAADIIDDDFGWASFGKKETKKKKKKERKAIGRLNWNQVYNGRKSTMEESLQRKKVNNGRKSVTEENL